MLEQKKDHDFSKEFKKVDDISDIYMEIEEYNIVKNNNFFQSLFSFGVSSMLLVYMGANLLFPFISFCFDVNNNVLAGHDLYIVLMFLLIYFGTILSLVKSGVRDVKNSLIKWHKKQSIIKSIQSKSFKLGAFFKRIGGKVLETNNEKIISDFSSMVNDYRFNGHYSLNGLNELINSLNSVYTNDLQRKKSMLELILNAEQENMDRHEEIKINDSKINVKEKLINML